MNNYPVLLFHSTDDRDLLSLRGLGNIRPELFEKLIVRLTKEFDIIGLDELVRCISGSAKQKDSLLAITFDDGPKSYITQALPAMEVHDVPSTCFLITDCVDDKALYWRYLYNFCINKGYQQELADYINYEYKANITTSEIIGFSRNHYDPSKSLCIIEKILDNVVSEEVYRKQDKDLFLSMEDIGKLKQNPLVSFGIHTRSHPVMKGLSDAEIHSEIAGSLEFYRSRIGDYAPMFSIPFGRLFMDYDERAIAIAQTLSINVVLSAYGGGNAAGQPLYNIRRISVHEGKLREGFDTFIKTLREPALPVEFMEKEKELSRRLSGKT
ncbi:MAG: polysaccharide deacetylase family protein [Thermodesulfovibrionales bacterium]